jgi:uncharacterized protein YdhG (YjbR/CyaY superfamily)
VLQQVRQTIRAAAPDAEETISYHIPAFTMNGKSLVHFAGWKQHISIYPVPSGDAAFQRRIAAYRAGKGTLQFPLQRPIPFDVIASAVAHLVAERSEGPQL